MTKKVVTVYGMLFLFAFTFALAFAMEARAEDPGDICCIVIPCESNPEYADLWGHIDGFGYCVNTDKPPCDIVGICPSIDP